MEWQEIATELADYCGTRPNRETYIAIGLAKKRAIAKIGTTGFSLIKAVCLGELYRRASTDDEEHVLAEDLLEKFDLAVDAAAEGK